MAVFRNHGIGKPTNISNTFEPIEEDTYMEITNYCANHVIIINPTHRHISLTQSGHDNTTDGVWNTRPCSEHSEAHHYCGDANNITHDGRPPHQKITIKEHKSKEA
jgi:hypothetical protein